MKIHSTFHLDVEPLRADWLAFQEQARGTFYQTIEWCSLWQEYVGRPSGVKPLVIMGRGDDGAIKFLLPFSIRSRQGVRVLEWSGSDMAGYGYGLYDQDFLNTAPDWFAHQGQGILRDIGGIDAVCLLNQPETLRGVPHPLTAWFTARSRNNGYFMGLEADYEALCARKRSAETRRGMRKRDARMSAAGTVVFGLPENRDIAHLRLDEMFAQQETRLSQKGIVDIFTPQKRAFLHALYDAGTKAAPVLLPYHLTLDGEMCAMMLGGNFDSTYWAMITSVTDGPVMRHSPGDAALRKTIEACSAGGMDLFDFSTGTTPYKTGWADVGIPLYDTVRAITPKGAVWALAKLGGLQALRVVKQTPVLWALASKIRHLKNAHKRDGSAIRPLAQD